MKRKNLIGNLVRQTQRKARIQALELADGRMWGQVTSQVHGQVLSQVRNQMAIQVLNQVVSQVASQVRNNL